MRALVGDVGATNARFAFADYSEGTTPVLRDIAVLSCKSFPSLAAAVSAYLRKVSGNDRPKRATIAVAGPVNEDVITLTNLDWSFSVAKTRAALGFDDLFVINDLAAVSLSLGALSAEALMPIGPVSRIAGTPTLGVIAPGTGLGMGGLIRDGERNIVVPSEGGHATFAPADEVEMALCLSLMGRYGHVSKERVLSGPGLRNIYQVLSEIGGSRPAMLSSEEIVARATAGADRVCVDSLLYFAAILGSAAGDLALTLCAGATFIGGGIAPKIVEFINRSRFRSQFENKGRFAERLKKIPTFIIMDPFAGLLGAAVHAAIQ
jgi:glucokinase